MSLSALSLLNIITIWILCISVRWVNISHYSNCPAMAARTWRDEILAGVDSVPGKGPVDTVVVYGENAEAILTGRNAPRVFIAAGLYGQGRVVVFSGREYTREMEMPSRNAQLAKLRSNVLKWLRPGHETHQVINITDSKTVGVSEDQNQVLLWQVEHPRKSEKFVQDVSDFIKKGGGAIFTKTPSGFECRHGSLHNSPIFNILHEVGIYFWLPRASVKDDKKIADNEAHLSHLGRAIDECLNDPRNLTIYGAILGFAVEALPQKEEVKNKLRRLLNEVESLGIRYIPRGSKKRVKTAEGINLAHFVHSFLWDPESGKAPGCEDFPGDFDVTPELVCVEVMIESKKYSEVHPVGAYLPPGGTVKLEVVEGDMRGWKLRVGAHSDELDKKDELKRWIRMMHLEKLKQPVTEVFHPFGGSIYLVSPHQARRLRVRISNVVESPLYDLQEEDSDERWNQIKRRPGLWADLKGQQMHITLPSTAIQDFKEKDIKQAIKFWDRVVKHFHDLRGTKARSKRGEWVVTDMQPGAGAMHSGYPIVTHLDVVEPDSSNHLLKTDPGSHWGMFHEMGHNMQKLAWTPDRHIEITCNIFSMYGMYIMYDIDPWQVGWVEKAKDKMKKFLQNEKVDLSPQSGIAIYAQLARDFGFDAYKKVFRSYKKMREKPRANQDKIDTWVQAFSTTVGYNILPAYELWRYTVSESVKQQLRGLTPYLPDDEVIQVVPEKVAALSAKYPGVVRKPTKYSSSKEDNCPADDEDEDQSEEENCSD